MLSARIYHYTALREVTVGYLLPKIYYYWSISQNLELLAVRNTGS
jgi:hypothetical protein